ncbi:BppU family phage baseplate upper protein [Niameybacter massiliensis]|uniref:BppU family phage baseplate upper protein n=1 Tax=Holtiella tumoricola TaxID=3018743 RepID=A0AA42DNR9_9FIRM|nr:BppU family phage baseplate upper protein [Holtiella tumoricola]MDA3732101.1 BppU family phage baseplate upper protein [Holtiella tumoricola]
MKNKEYEILIDIYRGVLNPQNIVFVTEDNGNCVLKFSILENKITKYNLSNCIIRMVIEGQQQDCNIIDATNGKCEITLLQSMFSKAGNYRAELQIYDSINQSLRLTTPTFVYSVRKSLMNDETAQADPNFSILQNMILEVSNANTVANQAKATAEGALTTANLAESKAAQIMANGDYAKAQGDYAKEQGAKFDKVLTIDQVSKSNFDFIRSKVVQDGLIENKNYTSFEATTFNPNDKNFTIIVKFTMSSSDGSILGNCPSSSLLSGFRMYTHASKDLYFGNSGASSINKLNTQGLNVGVEYTVVISKFDTEKYILQLLQGSSLLTNSIITKNYQSSPSTPLSIKGYGAGAGVAIGSDVYAIIYNQTLTPNEIQQNLQALNNLPSISQIATTNTDGTKSPYKLAADSEHVIHRNGYNAEECLTGIYDMCKKEFVSTDGSAITIPNAIDKSKILTAEIKGNTYKSVNLHPIVSRWNTTSNSYYPAEKIPTSALKPNTLYTIILINKHPDISEIYFNQAVIPRNKITGNFAVVRTKEILESNTDFIHCYNLTEGYVYNVDNIRGKDLVVLEGDQSAIANSITTGKPSLFSTQAIIDCNGLKYPFYWLKDGVKTPIVLGGTTTKKDVLELKEDGSAIYTQNTKDADDSSMRVDLQTPVVTAIPKELMPTIALQQSNTIKVDSGVAPSEFKVVAPVDRVSEMRTELDEIKAIINSPSNLGLRGNYAMDQYNECVDDINNLK